MSLGSFTRGPHYQVNFSGSCLYWTTGHILLLLSSNNTHSRKRDFSAQSLYYKNIIEDIDLTLSITALKSSSPFEMLNAKQNP
jgi:hypothetical protein